MDKKYMVVQLYGSLAEFIKAVNIAMEKGWYPIGGVSISFDPEEGRTCYCQAMVKK